jgi:hypothetical protein
VMREEASSSEVMTLHLPPSVMQQDGHLYLHLHLRLRLLIKIYLSVYLSMFYIYIYNHVYISVCLSMDLSILMLYLAFGAVTEEDGHLSEWHSLALAALDFTTHPIDLSFNALEEI